MRPVTGPKLDAVMCEAYGVAGCGLAVVGLLRVIAPELVKVLALTVVRMSTCWVTVPLLVAKAEVPL